MFFISSRNQSIKSIRVRNASDERNGTRMLSLSAVAAATAAVRQTSTVTQIAPLHRTHTFCKGILVLVCTCLSRVTAQSLVLRISISLQVLERSRVCVLLSGYSSIRRFNEWVLQTLCDKFSKYKMLSNLRYCTEKWFDRISWTSKHFSGFRFLTAASAY